MKKFSKFISLLFLMVLSMTTITVKAEESPLLKFAVLSDLHNQGSLISSSVNNVQLRGVVVQTLNKIKEEEGVDLLVLNGDYTSDVTVSQANWERVRQLMAQETRKVFKDQDYTPVIYVNGNHEYEVANFDNIPKPFNTGDYYSFPMKDDLGELPASECFYEEATNGANPNMNLLAAYHYKVKRFHFVALNAGKYFFQYAWNYQYSLESVQWIANKLDEIYRANPNETVFFLAHLPFSDSKNLSATNKGLSDVESTRLLKTTLSKYKNLIFLYGHDHGGDKAYIRNSTDERVTVYNSNGTLFTPATLAPKSRVAEKVDTQYYIRNESNSKYLGTGSYNLDVITAKTATSVISSTTNSDKFYLKVTPIATDQTNINRIFVHCGTNGKFSANTDTSKDQWIYEVTAIGTDNTLTAKKIITAPAAGKRYLIIGINGGKYYALRGAGNGSTGTDFRMESTQVTLSGENATVTGTDLIWVFESTQSELPLTERSFYFKDNNENYLGFNGNLNMVGSSKSEMKIINTTVTGSTNQFHVKLLSTTDDNYIHCGTNGYFSCNKTIGDGNLGTNLYLYECDYLTKQAKQATSITAGREYLIIGFKSPNYYVLGNSVTDANATGNNIRMSSKSLGSSLPTNIDCSNNTYVNNLWTIEEKTDPSNPVDPQTESFISAFCGSMRFYNNSIDGSVGENNSKIVQAMIVNVYRDHVSLQMKNFNQSGTINGITVNENLIPYTRSRVSGALAFNVKCKITGSGSVTLQDNLGNSYTLGQDIPENTELKLVFQPDNGHQLTDVKKDAQSIFESIQNQTYTIGALTKDMTFEIVYSASTGTLSPDGEPIVIENNKDQIRIIGLPSEATVAMMDLNGKKVADTNTSIIPTNNLPKGCYIIKIASTSGILVKKVIIE